MYIRNKVGPRTEPWETPDVTANVVDSTFLTTTRWFWLVKKFWIQFTMRGSTFEKFLSLSTSHL